MTTSRTQDDRNIKRRTVAKGVAWAAPVLAISAASPATAASAAPAPVLTIPIYAKSSNLTGPSQYTFVSASSPGATTSGPTFCVSNTTTASVISSAKVTMFLPIGTGVTFTNASGGSACWSALRYDPAGGTKTYNGCTLYAYTTTYTCAITATAGSTCLPTFSFTSPTNSTAQCTPYWYKDASVVVNGTKTSATSGPNKYT